MTVFFGFSVCWTLFRPAVVVIRIKINSRAIVSGSQSLTLSQLTVLKKIEIRSGKREIRGPQTQDVTAWILIVCRVIDGPGVKVTVTPPSIAPTPSHYKHNSLLNTPILNPHTLLLLYYNCGGVLLQNCAKNIFRLSWSQSVRPTFKSESNSQQDVTEPNQMPVKLSRGGIDHAFSFCLPPAVYVYISPC